MATTVEDYPALEQRVRMIVEVPGGKAAQVPVTVVSMSEEGRVGLRVVAHQKGVELGPGMQTTLEYVRRGAVYRLKSSVARIDDANGGGSILVLEAPQELKKIQRREDSRLYVSMEVAFTLVQSAGVQSVKGGPEGGPRFNGLVRQLGPGGMGMITDLAFNVGDRVAVTVTLHDEEVALRGEIVWTGGPDRLGDAGGGDFSHAVGIQFVDVTAETQSKVDDFVIIELERRQKAGI